MKHAKLMTAILLVLAFGVAMFAGCSAAPKEAGEISDYDSVAVIPVGDTGTGTEGSANDESAENSGTAAGGSFVVSDKTYAYGENNIAVLHVENQTDKNYSITLNGTYLDKNGEVLQEETKTFAGFAAGWQNNFFFIPGIAFDKFTYTLETTEYDEECLAQNYTLVWSAGESMVYDVSGSEVELQAFRDAYFAEHGEEFSFQGSKDVLYETYPDFPDLDAYWVEGANLSIGFAYDSSAKVIISRSAVALSADGEVLFARNWPATILLNPGRVSAEEAMQNGGGASLFDDNEEDAPLLEAIRNGEELNVLLGISMIRFYIPELDDPKIPLE